MSATASTSTPATPQRRSLLPRRSIFWLAAVIALLTGFAAAWQWQMAQVDIRQAVEDAGGLYDSRRSGSLVQSLMAKLNGISTVSHVIRFAPGRVSDEWLERNRSRIDALAKLSLTLSNSRVTDEGIAQLATASGILWLDVSESSITDTGVAILKQLPALTTLDLQDTRLTDASIKVLSSFPRLASLSLAGTDITDEGIARLPAGAIRSIALDAKQLTPISMESPILQGALVSFGLYDADDKAVARLLELNIGFHLTVQGEQVTNESLPVLEELIRSGTLRHVELLDVELTEDEVRSLKQIKASCAVNAMTTSYLERVRNSSRSQ
jgi:hypothetical protein